MVSLKKILILLLVILMLPGCKKREYVEDTYPAVTEALETESTAPETVPTTVETTQPETVPAMPAPPDSDDVFGKCAVCSG